MGKYPHGLSNKYAELIKQLRAPPGTDLTRLPYPLMLKDKVKDGRSDYRPESCMAELNLVFQVRIQTLVHKDLTLIIVICINRVGN